MGNGFEGMGMAIRELGSLDVKVMPKFRRDLSMVDTAYGHRKEAGKNTFAYLSPGPVRHYRKDLKRCPHGLVTNGYDPIYVCDACVRGEEVDAFMANVDITVEKMRGKKAWIYERLGIAEGEFPTVDALMPLIALELLDRDEKAKKETLDMLEKTVRLVQAVAVKYSKEIAMPLHTAYFKNAVMAQEWIEDNGFVLLGITQEYVEKHLVREYIKEE